MQLNQEYQGFTIIELVVVIIVIAILSIGVYTMWGTETITLYDTADTVGLDIQYARNLSMTTNSRYRVNLTSSTSYQILDSSGTAVTIPSTYDATTATLPSGFTLTTSDYLVFDGKGVPYTCSSPSTCSGTKLSVDLVLTLSDGSDSAEITITANTGRVSIS